MDDMATGLWGAFFVWAGYLIWVSLADIIVVGKS